MYDTKWQKHENEQWKQCNIDALQDMPQALLSPLFDIWTSCFDLLNKHIYRYCTLFSFFKENNEKLKNKRN